MYKDKYGHWLVNLRVTAVPRNVNCSKTGNEEVDNTRKSETQEIFPLKTWLTSLLTFEKPG